MTDNVSDDGFFNIVSHEVPAQHLREHEHAVIDEARPLRLAVKQYIPKSNTSPRDGDLTVICCPGAGIAKEAYEPFLEDLTKDLAARHVQVRAIWMADPAQLGRSALLNRGNLGNDFSWFDHSRDLLQIVQTFRAQMVRPIVGVGHSTGGSQVMWLALMHPGLFESVVMIEPNMLRMDFNHDAVVLAKTMLKRREQWDSMEQATTALRKNPFYAHWDPRVIKRLIQHQFIEASLSPSAEIQSEPNTKTSGKVATVVPRNIEFNTIFRVSREDDLVEGIRAIDERLYQPIVDSGVKELYPWYPPASVKVAALLPFVRTPVLYVVGEDSDFSTPTILAQRMKDTGTGLGGSGGATRGHVQLHVLKHGGHFDIFSARRAREVVAATAPYLATTHARFTSTLAHRTQWRTADPKVQQAPNVELVRALGAWNPGVGKSFDQLVAEMAKVSTLPPPPPPPKPHL